MEINSTLILRIKCLLFSKKQYVNVTLLSKMYVSFSNRSLLSHIILFSTKYFNYKSRISNISLIFPNLFLYIQQAFSSSTVRKGTSAGKECTNVLKPLNTAPAKEHTDKLLISQLLQNALLRNVLF